MYYIYKKLSSTMILRLSLVTLLFVGCIFYVSAQNNPQFYNQNKNQTSTQTFDKSIKQLKPQVIPNIAIEWSKKQQKLIAQNKAVHQLSGISSYYGKKFHKKLTANGEYFNMNDLTAAHRTLPFNTIVQVTNLSNGKNVTVRINDRGPFLENRVIDLSRAAAIKIAMLASGTAAVTLKIIQLGDNAKQKASLVRAEPKAVQIASYSKKYTAQNLIESLRKHKINSKIETYKHYYRVIVPVNASSFERVTKQLENLGYKNTLARYR